MVVKGRKVNGAIISVWIAGLTFAATGVAAWSDLKSDVRANNVRLEAQDQRISRYEGQIHQTLSEMRADVNSIKQYLLERGQ